MASEPTARGIAAARTFLQANARLVEQQVYAAMFEGGDADAVVRALVAYRNDDGGFGHGLEPDKRVPASQPLDVEIALERLVMAGAAAADLVTRACDWLATVADPSGAVPILLPSIAGYPRAEHFAATNYPPGLNPTAAIAAHALALGVSHPWVDRAADHCFSALEDGHVPDEAHTLLALSKLAASTPDLPRRRNASERLGSALAGARFAKMDPDSDDYGVTPLEFAPSPASLARSWFSDSVIVAHLDRLERDQQDDGGWPITWQPVSEATRYEWRAIRTLHALQVLAAYGRLAERPST